MTTTIYRDAFGIPHLRASDELALAHAQGYVTAIDRGWQIEIERHRAQGTSASILGPSGLEWDRFARKTLLDDTARRCFRRLQPHTRAWIRAYVDGVHAGLEQTQAPEFAACEARPGRWTPWTPLSIWLSTHILFAGFPTKLFREEVALRLGEPWIRLFATDGPQGSGSNGWLLPGHRTITGKPILAGDPHRFIEDPGVYQQIHLSCPDYDIVGMAVPGVPGVAHFGHAGPVAWAVTHAMADCQDLYREQLRRVGGEVQARGPDGFAPATVYQETIAVRGAESVSVEVIETERGVVVVGGADDPTAISLRYPPRAHEDLGFDALPALLRARCVADVDRALDRWVEPVNVVQAADAQGGLLHRTAGVVPIRHEDNALRLAPAWESERAWRGARKVMPRKQVDDIAVMANEGGVAASLGVEFAPPYRARRIARLLDRPQPWSTREMPAIHVDTHLASAEPLINLLCGLPDLTRGAERLRERLRDWDRRMAGQSADAALYAQVRAAVVRHLASQPVFSPLSTLVTAEGPYPELFHPWLALIPRVAFALEALLSTRQLPGMDREAAARAALEEVARDGACDTPWAQLHRLMPWRALAAQDDEDHSGLAGDHDCVLSTYSVPGLTHTCLRGPAARYVWDLAQRQDSLWIVPFGASGVRGSDHHRDQHPLWLGGELIPVVTDWARLREEQVLDRPPPTTAIHERHLVGFGTVRIIPVQPEGDLDLIYGWVTQGRARFWGMGEHSRDYVLEIYDYLASLSTHHAYLVYRDEEPVALFQTYQPEADPVGDHYPVERGDFGLHLLIGPTSQPRPGFTGTLLAVLIDHVLSNPLVTRLVAEPDVRNDKAITRFLRTGFTLGPEIELAEKRARLVFLPRTAWQGQPQQEGEGAWKPR